MLRITDFDDIPHEYLTVPWFAAYLTLHEDTSRKRIKAGVLPAYRFPPMVGEWRIAKTDAIEFIERSRFRV